MLKTSRDFMSNQNNFTLDEIKKGMADRDQVYRFLFDDKPVQGLWLSVEKALHDATLYYDNCPVSVKKLAGELLLVATIFRHYLKQDGEVIFTLNDQNALLRILSVSVTQDSCRCIIYFDESRVDEFNAESKLEDLLNPDAILSVRMMGNGIPYESIIQVNLNSIQDSILDFYRQSVQLPTFLKISSTVDEYNTVRANAFFMQYIASEEDHSAEFYDVVALAQTLTDDELLALGAHDILYRLFNQEQVSFEQVRGLQFKCKCSRDGMLKGIVSLGRDEIVDMFADFAQQGIDFVEATCNTCRKSYQFLEEEVLEELDQVDGDYQALYYYKDKAQQG